MFRSSLLPSARRAALATLAVAALASSVTLAAPAGAAVNHTQFGSADVVARHGDSLVVGGWTVDPDTNLPTAVEVWVDEQHVAQTTANGSRPDVGKAYPAAGPNHGFTVSVPISPAAHTACLIIDGRGEGPARVQLGCWKIPAAPTPTPTPAPQPPKPPTPQPPKPPACTSKVTMLNVSSGHTPNPSAATCFRWVRITKSSTPKLTYAQHGSASFSGWDKFWSYEDMTLKSPPAFRAAEGKRIADAVGSNPGFFQTSLRNGGVVTAASIGVKATTVVQLYDNGAADNLVDAPFLAWWRNGHQGMMPMLNIGGPGKLDTSLITQICVEAKGHIGIWSNKTSEDRYGVAPWAARVHATYVAVEACNRKLGGSASPSI